MVQLEDTRMLNRSRLPNGLSGGARALLNRAAVSGRVTVGLGLRAGLGASITSVHGLTIGDWVSVGRYSKIDVAGSIGHFTLMATAVQIIGREDHAIDEVGTPVSLSTWIGDRAARPGDRVDIGRDVWIGGNAVVLSGVHIGDGAIVAAGSVVTKSIEPFGIAVGNPARVVRLRFTDDGERSRHLEGLTSLQASLLENELARPDAG